jgi:hypothetical protein
MQGSIEESTKAALTLQQRHPFLNRKANIIFLTREQDGEQKLQLEDNYLLTSCYLGRPRYFLYRLSLGRQIFVQFLYEGYLQT